jgi:adhesin transport system membrane fusion protein
MQEKFDKAHEIVNRLSRRPWARKVIDRAFARWVPNRAEDHLDWVSDAEWARLHQEPLRARSVLRWLLSILIVLIVWAAFAEVDEFTRGIGKVIPSRQLQVLQSVDGGIVSAIHVSEGQVVEAGQLLLNIDETRFSSSLKENQAQYLALLAKAARLRALASGGVIEMPVEVTRDDPTLADQERALFNARRSELDTQLSIARQQLAQRSQELIEARARRDQAAHGYELSARELAVTQPLVGSGAVSEVELLRLQRDVSRYKGDRDQFNAQIDRIQAAITEANRKIQEVDLTFRNQARTELAEVMAKINSLSEGSLALSDRVKQAAIKSPVKGTIKRLLVNTVGGVVQPGKDVVEIVPLEDALLLEVRIQPKDIAFLHPGQVGKVRFTAYDYAIYGSLDAVVDQIGADTLTDEDKNSYYNIRVHTLQPNLGKNRPIIPGMQAQVDIKTGRKTILSYFLKPILRAHQRALTER